jgi:ATP-binding cassette, subfamily B, bacterial
LYEPSTVAGSPGGHNSHRTAILPAVVQSIPMDAPLRRYPPPRGDVHPDTSRGWLRRLAPIVSAHRVVFVATLAMALVANLLQVAVPAVVRAGIDSALTDRTAALAPYVWLLLVVGLARALLTLAYRYGLYRTAFQIDSDLRNRLYEHLTRLSFSYYDRVQSGQIISRANSDIRSVQLFLTFAPLMLMTLVMFVVALGYMLSIHVPLTLVAISPLPAVYWLGVRLRNELFPLSWIVQERQADVATIVDENIQGVRVVRSFAAERRQIDELARAATALRWANIRTVDMRARHNPVIENLPRLGTLLVLVYGGWLVISEEVTPGTLFAFTAYVTML